MFRIITEPKELIGRYVGREIGIAPTWGDFAAVALVKDDELVAGAVFYGFSWPNIMMHIAGECFTAGFVAAVVDYPFRQLKCRSMSGVIHKKNRRSRDFAEHLGAKYRGTLFEAAPDDDVMMYQLMAADARKWMTPRYVQKMVKEVAYG